MRDPAKPQARATASAYITPAGQRRLQLELQQLWKVQRPAVTRKVAEAAAMGDRSENAEYIYGKKQLRELDRRIRYLSKRLDVLQVVERPPQDQQRVYFGAWVALENQAGERLRYRIVGPDEFDMAPGYISLDSPLARALLRHSSNDLIEVRLGARTDQYRLCSIHYQDPAWSETMPGSAPESAPESAPKSAPKSAQ